MSHFHHDVKNNYNQKDGKRSTFGEARQGCVISYKREQEAGMGSRVLCCSHTTLNFSEPHGILIDIEILLLSYAWKCSHKDGFCEVACMQIQQLLGHIFNCNHFGREIKLLLFLLLALKVWPFLSLCVIWVYVPQIMHLTLFWRCSLTLTDDFLNASVLAATTGLLRF